VHVVVPAGTTSEVWIPAKENGVITEQGLAVEKVDGFKGLSDKSGYEVISVGSGEYYFRTETK